MSPPFSGPKNKPSKSTARYLFHAVFLLGLLFNPENGDDVFLRNVGYIHGVIYKKTELFGN
jgi:hypothetical protein